MDELEAVEMLLKGALIFVDDSGEISIPAHDLPPSVRECYRASRHKMERWAQLHRSTCPDCLEAEADACEMDAASHREDGNADDARALEGEAAEIRQKAARIRAAGN